VLEHKKARTGVFEDFNMTRGFCAAKELQGLMGKFEQLLASKKNFDLTLLNGSALHPSASEQRDFHCLMTPAAEQVPGPTHSEVKHFDDGRDSSEHFITTSAYHSPGLNYHPVLDS